jgi:hypothetical protein
LLTGIRSRDGAATLVAPVRETKMRRQALAIFAGSLLALPAAAQVGEGDWVVASLGDNQPGLHAFNRTLQTWTVVAANPLFRPAGVAMALDNASLVVPNVATYTLDAVSASGSFLPPVAQLTTLSGQAVPDQDGTYAVAQDYGLFRVDPLTSVETLLWAPIGVIYEQIRDVCVDLDTGDFIVASVGPFSVGSLIRVSRDGASYSTLATGLGDVRDVDHCTVTGEFYVANGAASDSVLRVSRFGTVSSLGSSVPVGTKALRVDPATGRIVAVGPLAIALLTTEGILLASYPTPFYLDEPSGIEIFGSHTITGIGPATGGTDYEFQIAFPNAAGHVYLAALSDGLRPGFPFLDGTGRILSLADTPLVWQTIGGIPGLLDGFVGVLDGGGFGTAVVRLPVGMPAGSRYFVGVIALPPMPSPSPYSYANVAAFTTL